jgi:GntR family transcriptional regulator, transcriptional repressor for pyruvate dehydrogenase complex
MAKTGQAWPPLNSRRHSHRPKKTAILLAQRMVTEIADHHLEPGTPLPPERVMLERYGVARGSLREALRFLEIQGVLTIKTGPSGGPIVSRPDSKNLASVLAMMLQLEHAKFNEILEARQVMEPPLAGLAAERMTDEQIEVLHQSVVRMRTEIEDGEAFLDENQHFHELIADAAGNHVFALFISSLNWISDASVLGVSYPIEARRSVCKEHGRIHQAVADRDADRAAAAMRVHVGDFAAYVRKQFPQAVEAELTWGDI